MKNEECLLEGIKEKFANARELFPGMSEDFYYLTDYLSKILNDTLNINGLSLGLVMAKYDIERGVCGFEPHISMDSILVERRTYVIAQLLYIPQFVDKIASKEFAEKFREICKEELGMNPAIKNDAPASSEYPEYVVAAVDWWASAIQSPSFNNGDPMAALLGALIGNTRKTISPENIQIFKDVLAKSIVEEVDSFSSCTLSVDYEPCLELEQAGRLIGLNGMTDYPIKTSMYISKSEVKVKEGYGSQTKTIWQGQPNQTLKRDINKQD